MSDALLPPERAQRAEEIGARKAAMPILQTVMLGVLAGAFIGLGGQFSIVASTGAAAVPWGLGRVAAGLCFSLGLGLVVVGGAELFTGNNLLAMAWASRRITTRALLRNWALVYAGNLVGAVGTAALVALSGVWRAADGGPGRVALDLALAKVQLPFLEAVVRGVLCNALVCLAVWLSFSARSTSDRLAAVVLPVAAFVAMGFEHSVANMYFVPLALFLRALAPAPFWTTIGKRTDDYAAIDWGSFLGGNLLPVTLGNILGGTVLVAAVYWVVYLRAARPVA